MSENLRKKSFLKIDFDLDFVFESPTDFTEQIVETKIWAKFQVTSYEKVGFSEI